MSLSSAVTTFVSSVIEAWGEVYSNKLRIALSLVGVALSVASLVAVVTLGGMARESFESFIATEGGRRATITYIDGSGDDVDTVTDRYQRIINSHRVNYAAVVTSGSYDVQTPRGTTEVNTKVVTSDYGAIHGLQTSRGRWFVPEDSSLLAPVVVINEKLWNQLERPPLDGTGTMQIWQGAPTTARIVGTVADSSAWDTPRSFTLWAQGQHLALGASSQMSLSSAPAGSAPTLELWVPEDIAPELTKQLNAQAEQSGGQALRTDAGEVMGGGADPFTMLQVVLGTASVLIMAIGALGLVSVSLTTMQHRVREIGIRRSFGATGRRIFFGVMMESVVATFLAGLIGVVLAVVVLRQPFVLNALGGMTAGVPVSAALIGIGAATLVGALAGLGPATYAARAPVIEAIRF